MIKESITENRINRLEQKIKNLEKERIATIIVLVIMIFIQVYDILKK